MRKGLALLLGLGVAVCGIAQSPSHLVVAPLCSPTSAWNQTGELNRLIHMDRGYVCGCDPLAWGQVATYHGLESRFPAADWTPQPLTQQDAWVQLQTADGARTIVPRQLSGRGYDWKDVAAQGPDAGRLMWDLGILGHTLYVPGVSMGTVSNVRAAAYFGYQGQGWCYSLPLYTPPEGDSPILQSDWPQLAERLVRGSLHAGAPLVVMLNTTIGGHAVICDGYGYDEKGTPWIHLHYGWGTPANPGVGWMPMVWFWSEAREGDRFRVLYANVHPQDLNCVLAGVVTQEKKPVEGVTVKLSNGKSVTTTAAGGYCFVGLAPRTTYTVTVQLPTGETLEKQVTTGQFLDDSLRSAAQDEVKDRHVSLEVGNVLADFELAEMCKKRDAELQ